MGLVRGKVERAIEGQVEEAEYRGQEDKADGGTAAKQHFTACLEALRRQGHSADPPWSGVLHPRAVLVAGDGVNGQGGSGRQANQQTTASGTSCFRFDLLLVLAGERGKQVRERCGESVHTAGTLRVLEEDLHKDIVG